MQQLRLFPFKQKEEPPRPKRIKVASWNVNSIRARREQFKEWLKRESPDVVCIQETKVKDEDFPVQDFLSLGYNVVSYGEPGYNGVAILSKFRIEDVVRGFEDSPDTSARVISGRILGLKIYSVYAPNAKNLTGDSFKKKVEWYTQFIKHIKKNDSPDEQLLLCGDFNIVSQDYESFDPKHWLCSTVVDPTSRSIFSELLYFGLVDIMRIHTRASPLYTWWDYGQGLEIEKGMRLDYFLTSSALANKVITSKVDRYTRELEKPSDHAPIICELELK